MPSQLLQLVSDLAQDLPAIDVQHHDHAKVLDGYLDTHTTRNHSSGTRDSEAAFLRRWFSEQGPGKRPLFVWEAMAPIAGRERVVAYAKKLLLERKCVGATVGGHMGVLRRLFDYVLAWPYIPDTAGVSIQARYGPVEQPVLAYDYPRHVWGGRREDAPLSRSELKGLYAHVRGLIGAARKPPVVARNYTMAVLTAESGLRVQELCALELERDLLFSQARLQTRAGKGSSGSGPRVRQTIFTPFAQATVRHFVSTARSSFRRWSHEPYLFLSERGRMLSTQAAGSVFSALAAKARAAGLRIPPRFGWHSLRRSFATIYSEEHPGCNHTLMEMLGHENPSTLHHYIHHSRAYHERVMDEMLQDVSDPR
jgi:integrase